LGKTYQENKGTAGTFVHKKILQFSMFINTKLIEETWTFTEEQIFRIALEENNRLQMSIEEDIFAYKEMTSEDILSTLSMTEKQGDVNFKC